MNRLLSSVFYAFVFFIYGSRLKKKRNRVTRVVLQITIKTINRLIINNIIVTCKIYEI
jgi:hypothetical protein